MIAHKAKLGPQPIDCPKAFRLGRITVDPERNAIAHGDGERPVEPRVMELLLYLSERPRQVVSKQELIAAVWQTNVVDEAVHRAVSLLRSALRDSSQHPAIIETVPRRGYRLLIEPQPMGSALWPKIVARRAWLLAAALAAAALALPLADGGREEARQGPEQAKSKPLAARSVKVENDISSATPSMDASPVFSSSTPTTPRAEPAEPALLAPMAPERLTPRAEAPEAEAGEYAPVAPQN